MRKREWMEARMRINVCAYSKGIIPAHLCALRREASGVFTLEEAIAVDDIAPECLMRVATAATRALPPAEMTVEGAERARCGAKLTDADFVAAPPDGESAWLDGGGELVAVGERVAEGPKVVRVFNLNG